MTPIKFQEFLKFLFWGFVDHERLNFQTYNTILRNNQVISKKLFMHKYV